MKPEGFPHPLLKGAFPGMGDQPLSLPCAQGCEEPSLSCSPTAPPHMWLIPGDAQPTPCIPILPRSCSHPPAGWGESPAASMSQECRLSPSSPFWKHWQPLLGLKGQGCRNMFSNEVCSVEKVWGRRAGGKLSPCFHGALFSPGRDGAHGFWGPWIFQSFFLLLCCLVD